MILSCPFCKAKADPAAIQCASCGKTMSRACPACAETIASNATACKYCGEVVPAMKAAAPVKPTPDIVYLDCKTRKSCCGAGRSMFWILVLTLAGFCAYSAVKTRLHLHGAQQKQQISAPAKDF
ncbi:MAG TPA: zinc ribbon domain-containing protein [Planctomycetota bacterium]|nr:zinc ribbon domain-containing protein [Planctomycetota bacterium]